MTTAQHSALRRRLIEAFEHEGWLVDANPAGPMQRVGRSDLTACADGRFFAVEIKTGAATLERTQKRYQMLVEQAGGVYIVARSVTQAVTTIRRYLDGRTRRYVGDVAWDSG